MSRMRNVAAIRAWSGNGTTDPNPYPGALSRWRRPTLAPQFTGGR